MHPACLLRYGGWCMVGLGHPMRARSAVRYVCGGGVREDDGPGLFYKGRGGSHCDWTFGLRHITDGT